ncbi:MAG: VRR-NUC domain-containing protein [Alphaproteobacteria bacterium]|nr:VRR-NUC domain-containing protein [Alphaproteobacteria bacterium]
MLAYAKTDIVQKFLRRVDSDTYAKIVYRIAQNPNENRSGVPDFIIWNDDELKMIEIKKVREQVRESQINWLSWMVDENIPVEIVRVKGVSNAS